MLLRQVPLMPRDIPFQERKPKKRIEDDEARRAVTLARFPPPTAVAAPFREGYRECIGLYALHAPDKRTVARILQDHMLLLEDACLRDRMSRDALAAYEGYRQAMKDLRAARCIR